MARPEITNICRRVIPLGGWVGVEGENFVEDQTEVYVQHNEMQIIDPDPSDPNSIPSGGGWGMWPGTYVATTTHVRGGTKLFFTLPDDSRWLSSDEEFTTSTGAWIHNISSLAVVLNDPIDGYSNTFPPDPIGLKTVPRSTYDDPPAPGVHTHSLVDLEDLLLDMINEIRNWNDVAPVAMNSTLRTVARAHSQLMNDHYCWSGFDVCSYDGWSAGDTQMHQGPGEDSARNRVEDAGSFAYGGEICAWNWGWDIPVKHAAETWDNSCPHREIMINSSQRLVGVGIARSERRSDRGHTAHYYTFTVDFAR